jgi:hypothetical protein
MSARGGAPRHGVLSKKRHAALHIRFGSLRFYLILAVVAAVLLTVESILGSMPFAAAMPDQQVVLEFQKKQIDTWSDMNKLLVALATATIGAVGGFLVHRDKDAPLTPRQRRRAALSWLWCAASLYFGYLSYQQIAWMLGIGFFDAHNPRLYWPARAQFWCFLAAVVLFADFVYGSVRDKSLTE